MRHPLPTRDIVGIRNFFARRTSSFLFLLLGLVLSSGVSFGQTYYTPLYSESFGTPSANTNAWGTGQYTGYQNAAANYYAAGYTTVPTARNTTVSSYTVPAPFNNGTAGTASGTGNIFLTASATAAAGLGIQNINTSSVPAGDELWLGFGAIKGASTTVLVAEYSTDGTSWTAVSFTPTTAWAYYTAQLPNTAKVANLRVRFGNTANNQNGRIDDVRLIRITPAVTPLLTADFSGLNKLLATPSLPSDRLPIALTAANLNQAVTVSCTNANFEFSTSATGNAFTPSLSMTFGTTTTISAQTVYVRLKATTAGTSNTGTITVASATTPTPPTSLTSSVSGAAYATGNQVPFQTDGSTIVLAQLGDADYSQVVSGTTYSSPMFLLELNKSTGAVVQSFPVPYVLPSANNGNTPPANTNPLTVAGTTTTSAQLNLSPDKQYLTVTGYTAPLGILNTTARVSSTYPKVIAMLDYQANLNTSTTINDAYEADNLRSAVTTDGTKLWTAGASSSVQGIRYTTKGTVNTSTGVTTSTVPNVRYVNITNSQIYVSSNSTSSGNFTGINKVGNGLQTSGAAYTNVIPYASPGLADAMGFVFADRTPTVAGNDVIYVADNTNGVVKYSYDGSSWTYRGTISGNCQGIYAEDKGASGVDLYITWCNTANPSTGTNTSKLYKITDVSAHASNISFSGTALTASGTLLYTAPGSAYLRGVSAAPIFVPVPNIDVVAAAYPQPVTLTQGAVDKPIYSIQLKVSNGAATLNTLNLTTTGTYTSSDVSTFKLYSSTDNVFDASDVPFGGSFTSTSTGAGETISFSPSQAFPISNNNYIFLTADLSSCATSARTIQVSALSALGTNLVFNSGTPTTTVAPTAGTLYTIAAGGAPSNVTALTPTQGPSIAFNWTNPVPLCPGFKMVAVAYTSSNITAPNPATDYSATANANYTLAPSIGNGKVVYQGTGTSFTLTGLTIGTTYYVKVFVTSGTALSTGVVASATAQYKTLYSQSSGNITSNTASTATWSLTAAGPGLPITDPSIGGLSATTRIVVQSGHTITMTFSQLNALDIIVNNGGTFTSTGTLASPQYINLFGGITNNGTFGSASVYTGINVEGVSTSIGGLNPVYLARIRKSATTNATSTLTVTGKVNLNFNGTSIYNNVAATTLNIVVAAGAVVTNTDPAGAIALDGTDGTGSGERGGSYTVNGTLDAGLLLYSLNNNTSNATPFTIGATGTVLADSARLDQTAGGTSTFTITAGGKLKLRRHLQLVSGNLASGVQLLSQNGRTARIGQLGAQTLGNITVERQFPAAAGWHFIGTPIKAVPFSSWSGLNGRVSPKNNANLFYFTEGDTTRGTYYGYLTEVRGWKVVPSLAQTVNSTGPDVPNGYRLYTTGLQKASITGVPFIGAVSKNLTFTPGGGWDGGGWNLVSNPYPSEINWDAVKASNPQASLNGTIYIWNNGAYATYTPAVGGTNGGSKFIASSQGFLVKVTAANTLSFAESHKAVSTPSYLRAGERANTVHLFLENGTYSDEAILAFQSDATEGFDAAYDGHKLAGDNLNISTVTAGLNLAVNIMPELTATRIIPVRTEGMAAGTYTLRFSEVASMDADLVLYLRDKYLNTLTDLTQTDRYAFSVTANPATTASRFEIVAGPAAVTSVSPRQEGSMLIFPNPSKGSFKVSATGMRGTGAQIQIVGVDGRVAFRTNASISERGTVEIPVSAQLAKGFYTVHIVAGAQALTEKLIVE